MHSRPNVAAVEEARVRLLSPGIVSYNPLGIAVARLVAGSVHSHPESLIVWNLLGYVSGSLEWELRVDSCEMMVKMNGKKKR